MNVQNFKYIYSATQNSDRHSSFVDDDFAL